MYFESIASDEIGFAMTLFVNYANEGLRSPIEPDAEAGLVDQEGGKRLFFTLSFGPLATVDEAKQKELLQTSLYRTFSCLWSHYAGDHRRESICARVFGFCCLMEKTRGALVEQWMVPSPLGPERIILHPAIVEAVASTELSAQGRMSERVLIADIYSCWRAMKPESLPRVPQGTALEKTWPSGRGELAALVRERDWSESALGSVERWPHSLRNYIDLLLACSFPMVVLWGPDLLQFYNDAYCDVMGVKHPAGLGQATRECWPEVWHFNESVYDKVLRGETLTFEDQLFPIHRYGFLEDAYLYPLLQPCTER
ncbi:MAG: hypothetical protein ACRYFU_06655 [Janthinobacterium lividum]